MVSLHITRASQRNPIADIRVKLANGQTSPISMHVEDYDADDMLIYHSKTIVSFSVLLYTHAQGWTWIQQVQFDYADGTNSKSKRYGSLAAKWVT